MSSDAMAPVGYGDFLIEVKTQIGQRQFFNTYSEKSKLQSLVGEISGTKNLLIGIVICRSKTRPLGIATYTVTPQLPADFQDELPSPEQIAERLAGWARDSAEFEGDGV